MSNEMPEMNCEEFAELGLDAERGAAQMSALQRAAWETHRRACPRCAAESESLRLLRGQLCALAGETRAAQTPPRVEMQLQRQVKLLGYRRRGERRKTAFAAAILAAAAALVAAAGVRHWMRPTAPVAGVQPLPPVTPPPVVSGAAETPAESASVAGEFVLLPGGLPDLGDDSAILRVRLQRAALGAMGLPVNEEASGEWVLVDLLVSADGQPQAVRLLR
ncbi:MAG: hypothetical protein LAN84_10470 [Acidobacteriia bacterium]|nr:hypothetical protein [Terriglobia bacterium]